MNRTLAEAAEDFALDCAHYRHERRLTQPQLATRTFLWLSVIQAFEAGRRPPTAYDSGACARSSGSRTPSRCRW